MSVLPGHELVGARLVGQLPSGDIVNLWRRVASGIVKYGFVIEYRDLEAPRTGIFDGLRIVIDPDVDFEMQCFLLLHLFGHSVQWVSPALEHKLEELQRTDDRVRFMHALRNYEFEADAPLNAAIGKGIQQGLKRRSLMRGENSTVHGSGWLCRANSPW
jgi:hypothetical protein